MTTPRRISTTFTGMLIGMVLALFVIVVPFAYAGSSNGRGEEVPSFQSTKIEVAGGPEKVHQHVKQIYGARAVYVNEITRANAAGYGLGWCIDYGVNDPVPGTVYLPPAKLTRIGDKSNANNSLDFNTAYNGELRDSAIHMTKQLLKAYKTNDRRSMSRYATALGVLLGNNPQTLRLLQEGGSGIPYGGEIFTNKDFIELSGFKITGRYNQDNIGMERVPSVPIPKAGANEYLTVLVPKNFTFTLATKSYSTNQRVIPPDQPGLDPDPDPGINDVCVENTVTVTGPNGVPVTDKTVCNPEPEPEPEPQDINVAVTKVDADNQALPLPGAEFTLYPSDQFGRPDYTQPSVLSSQDGSNQHSIKLKGNGGVYHLVETKAPDGYSLLLHPVTFNLTRDTAGKINIELKDTGGTLINASVDQSAENIVRIEVADVKTGQLPHTGGVGVVPLALSGLLVIGAGAWLGYQRRRRVYF